ncbi:MAG: TonB-dependent receptor, partial [Candidatus Eremiobacteraeota bacterium]|nr:TonB-dependent receptor [Candidatus Eremiobacteraeota bacterium]
MRIFYRTAAALAFATIGLAGPASAAARHEVVAQATQGTLAGKVTDVRGAPIGGANVTAEGGGNRASTTTQGDGTFTLSLPPGLYSVTINRGGFQTAQSDVAITSGATFNAAITLQESTLQTLQVIGRTGVTTQRTPFNVSEATVNVLPQAEIALRQNNNLTDIVADMPGVIATRTFSSTPNTNFAVRGAALQTRVTIDGHPVSNGIVGEWNTNYAISSLFQAVEVDKGTGLNGSIAGESAVGTVNLRTRDFTPRNSYSFTVGPDSYGSGLYNALVDVNLLKDNRLSLIVGKAYQAFNGPWQGQFLNRAGTTSGQPIGLGVAPQFNGLDQWMGDFSNRYSLEGQLIKARYRFSESTSLTGEFLGMQGQYQPQGGSYGSFLGLMTLQACQNGSAFQPTLATCTSQSTYTAPYSFSNIGNQVAAYTWFPNSFIQNNEPQFAAELRTAYKNDTILFRPYTHDIYRYISGVSENQYPGNGGQWFAVTNAANCQVKYIGPGATGGPATGAAGPCFPATMQPNSPAYVGNDTTPVVFSTTTVAPTCSATPPFTCFTTPT